MKRPLQQRHGPVLSTNTLEGCKIEDARPAAKSSEVAAIPKGLLICTRAPLSDLMLLMVDSVARREYLHHLRITS